MKILAVSDVVRDAIYSPLVKDQYGDIDCVISCGDLPYSYLEFLIDSLDIPLFFVRGNHDSEVEYSDREDRRGPWGGDDLHRKTVIYNGVIFGGFEGSVRYRNGNYQYSQFDMWLMVLSMVPRLIFNRIFHGRAIDILITHSPAWGINDSKDRVHRGFKALRWFLYKFKPQYHLHGHVHLHGQNKKRILNFEKTTVINVYGDYCADIELMGT